LLGFVQFGWPELIHACSLCSAAELERKRQREQVAADALANPVSPLPPSNKVHKKEIAAALFAAEQAGLLGPTGEGATGVKQAVEVQRRRERKKGDLLGWQAERIAAKMEGGSTARREAAKAVKHAVLYSCKS
jgi:hypothetical protein